MSTSLFSNTPTVRVFDNRDLTVRDIAYHRHPNAPDVTTERITRQRYNARGFLTQSTDPRLHQAGLANFTYITDLAGNALYSQGADNGSVVTLRDAAQRPIIAVSNIHTAVDGAQDLSQAVSRSWQYEGITLPGRPLSITEQLSGARAHMTERFVYAGNLDAHKAHNLAGACISHYDTAGLVQSDSMAINAVPLAVTRRLLKDADNPDSVADWQGADASVWNDLLETRSYTTLTSADATGATLSITDAKGNLQQVAYDVAGLLSASWLMVQNGKQQVIVKSLSYTASGQKLREEHGNGVVTRYMYEPETQRLAGIKTERPTGHAGGAKVLQDLRYEYDPVGNLLKISNDAEETRFWRNQKVVPENACVYDSLYQLVSATGREMVSNSYTNYSRAYSYDSAGNLTRISHSSPASSNNYSMQITISDRCNRGVLSTLTENPAEVEALFTAGGQQRQLQPGQRLLWTQRNELLQVTPVVRDGGAHDSESYRYDAGSQRLLKVSRQQTGGSVQTSRTLYLTGLEQTTSLSGTSEIASLQVITIGKAGQGQVRVLHWESGIPAGVSNDQLRYCYDNLTGRSQLELDGEGSVISMEEFYPYGGTAVWTARSAMEADYKTVRYSGKERDATGLYYYGYRYYQPWVGRWLSADPAGPLDGLNLFRMVRNNPLRFFDKDGLEPGEEKLQQEQGRAYLKEAKSLAAEQLSAAEKFLSNRSNNQTALDIYKTFFGQQMGEEKLEKWKTQIKSVLEGVKKLDTKRNVRYSSKKITASGVKSESVAAEADVVAFQREEKIYMNAYSDVLGKVKNIATLGVDHLAHILIHEVSHLRLNTEDMAYIGVMKHEGSHELNALLGLLEPEKLPTSKGEREETPGQRRMRGSLDALKNADSFTTATRYLAYTAKKANFYSHFSQQKQMFKPGAPSLITNPRWKS